MKNKKGFTLTELLIVIVLLVVITGSTVFGIEEITKNSKEKRLNELIKEIEFAADVYINSNEIYSEGLLNGEITEKCTRLYVLQNESLLETNLINPVTDEEIPGNLCVMSKVNDKGNIEHTFTLE